MLRHASISPGEIDGMTGHPLTRLSSLAVLHRLHRQLSDLPGVEATLGDVHNEKREELALEHVASALAQVGGPHIGAPGGVLFTAANVCTG